MAVEIKTHICDGYALKWLIGAALDWLTYNQEVVNRLNVFPVPDGDTGKNMVLTLRKGYQAIMDHADRHVGMVADRVANGVLLGARGNSGVILSQLIRGFADELAGHEVMDADLLLAASSRAVEAAYKAVVNPTEGTILTVARGIHASLIAQVDQDRDLVAALRVMVQAGKQTLATTPDLLPVLKEAGVVDSGGQGLVFILEGMLRAVDGEQTNYGSRVEEDTPPRDVWDSAFSLEPDDEEGYGYDVQFLMHGNGMNIEQVRRDIDAMGWSTLVVGSHNLIKVHVHVHDPGQPISYAIAHSDAIDDVVVENMQLQYESIHKKSPAKSRVNHVPGVAVVTVASGQGLTDLFLDAFNAAYVISGGQTMNPSADDFLRAIELLDNQDIILMPNNKNIVLAAKQAANLADGRNVCVLPTTSIPQGISAMVGYLDLMDSGSLEEIVAVMAEFRDSIITIEITRATREARINGLAVREGQFIGMLDGKLVAGGDELTSVVLDTLRKAGADERELVTLYYGSGMTESEAHDLAAVLGESFSGQQFEIVHGGQPLYPLLMGIE